jgi:hypothetical protein
MTAADPYATNTEPTAYGPNVDTMTRAYRTARAYPAIEAIRADANRRRAGMSRVIAAEPDARNGWADAARCELRTQGYRHDAAMKAAEIVALLGDWGGITLGTYDTQAWHAVQTIAAELAALAAVALAERPYYQAAADNIPDCPTPYAHNLAHHTQEDW